MDGLIHISELSWSHVNHPSEVLEIGQKVDVKVLDIDRDRQRISLGLKQTQTDPWQQVLESYQEGDVVAGKVTKVVTFGAFVEILPGVEGLVHISELAQHHVENPREVVSQGDTVNVRILEVDAERRRLSLSLKRVEDGMPMQPMPGEDAAPPAIDLSEDVFSDEAAAAPKRRPSAGRGRAAAKPKLPREPRARRRTPSLRTSPRASRRNSACSGRSRSRSRAVSRRARARRLPRSRGTAPRPRRATRSCTTLLARGRRRA